MNADTKKLQTLNDVKNWIEYAIRYGNGEQIVAFATEANEALSVLGSAIASAISANKRIAELITKLNIVENDYIEMEKRSLKRIAELEAKLQPSPQPEADETPKPQVGETWHTVNDGDVIIRKVRDCFVDVSHVKKPDEIAGAVSIRHLTAKVEDKPVELKPGMIWKNVFYGEWYHLLSNPYDDVWICGSSENGSVTFFVGKKGYVKEKSESGQWLEVSTGKPVQPC